MHLNFLRASRTHQCLQKYQIHVRGIQDNNKNILVVGDIIRRRILFIWFRALIAFILHIMKITIHTLIAHTLWFTQEKHSSWESLKFSYLILGPYEYRAWWWGMIFVWSDWRYQYVILFLLKYLFQRWLCPYKKCHFICIYLSNIPIYVLYIYIYIYMKSFKCDKTYSLRKIRFKLWWQANLFLPFMSCSFITIRNLIIS